MLESLIQKYSTAKQALKNEWAMRKIARAISGSEPTGRYNQFYLPLLISAPIAITSCAATQEYRQAQQMCEPPAHTKAKPSKWQKGVGIGEPFGTPRSFGFHKGIDYPQRIGTPVAAMANGIVIEAQESGMDGNRVLIYHGNRFVSDYAHLDEIQVKPGEFVFRGQKIGTAGQTGGTYPHLHSGLRIHTGDIIPVFCNPANFWAEENGPYTYDGIIDHDEDMRKNGVLKLSAPFQGPLPKGKSLDEILKTAKPENIEQYKANPEKHQELYEATIALIAKKQKTIAEQLTKLPILNDDITKEEAQAVLRLYETIKNVDFGKDFGKSRAIIKYDSSGINNILSIEWGLTQKRTNYEFSINTYFIADVFEMNFETGDELQRIIPGRIKISSVAGGGDIDEIYIVTNRLLIPENLTLYLHEKPLTQIQLGKHKETTYLLNDGDIKITAKSRPFGRIMTKENALQDIIEAGIEQPYNQVLQALIKYSEKKDPQNIIGKYRGKTTLLQTISLEE